MNPLTSLKILDNRLKLLALLAPKTNFEKNRFFGYAIENGQRAPNVNRLTYLQEIGQQIKTFVTPGTKSQF